MSLQQTTRAIADPIRREILNLLEKGGMSAGEICEHFSVTKPSNKKAAKNYLCRVSESSTA